MNFYSMITLEVVKNERVYRFEVPVGAPYADAHEAALELAAEIPEMQKKAEEFFKNQQAQKEKVDEQSSN